MVNREGLPAGRAVACTHSAAGSSLGFEGETDPGTRFCSALRPLRGSVPHRGLGAVRWTSPGCVKDWGHDAHHTTPAVGISW